MMTISCPWCGARNQDEFSCGGEAHVQRPPHPELVSDEGWAEYQFMRKNPCGLHHERWFHHYGCRQWFHIARDTTTHEILIVYPIGKSAPELPQ